MSYTRFDRHEHMSDKTRKLILDVIWDVPHGNSTLKNELFGLFDGYLYDDILERIEKLKGKKIKTVLKKIIEEVKGYPKTSDEVADLNI